MHKFTPVHVAGNYCTILLPLTYVNVMFDNRSGLTNQICLRLALNSPPNCFSAQEHERRQWHKFSHYWPSLNIAFGDAVKEKKLR